jgi:hypothetical protein
LRIHAVRFTDLRYFISQLGDAFFDGILHGGRLADPLRVERVPENCHRCGWAKVDAFGF